MSGKEYKLTIDRLHQDGKIDAEAYTILKDRNKQAINYSQCCTELKVDKKAEINKLSDLLKDTEEDEGLKLNNPIEWGRRVGYLEGKINYICNL